MATRARAEIDADIEATRMELVQLEQEIADLDEVREQKAGEVAAAQAKLKELEGEEAAP